MGKMPALHMGETPGAVVAVFATTFLHGRDAHATEKLDSRFRGNDKEKENRKNMGETSGLRAARTPVVCFDGPTGACVCVLSCGRK